MKKFLLLPFFFFALTSLAQTKLTIQNSNEPWGIVYSNARNNVINNQGLEAARTNFGGKNGAFYTIRSFIQFDLSSIPAGSKVNWARLTLFGGGALFDGGPNITLIRRVISAWDPATLTWDNQPSTTERGTVRLPMSTSTNEDYKNIDVWTLVQAMVDNPSTSFGFAIRMDTGARGNINRVISFQPPGSSFPHKTPKLVIEYTAPGMQPAVTSTSIDLSGSSTQMTIYPNPCNKTFNCNIKSASTDNMSLLVIDMLGRTVYSQPVNTSNLQMRVNLPSSSAGTYFVVLQDSKGSTLVSQQLVVN